uniref:Uncharacterized protein n=1 Tax=Terrapene triunguis TaxID=2587831 RepID=A0A674IHT2_9SAUR
FTKLSPNLAVSTPPLHDPLLKEVQGRFLEGGLIQQCETGRIYSAKEINDLYKAKLPLLPLGRQNMDAADWLKIPPGYSNEDFIWICLKALKRARVLLLSLVSGCVSKARRLIYSCSLSLFYI